MCHNGIELTAATKKKNQKEESLRKHSIGLIPKGTWLLGAGGLGDWLIKIVILKVEAGLLK